MLKEISLWKIAGKIMLAGSLFAAGYQPGIVDAAQHTQADHKTQSANERQSVSIVLDGKPLNRVTGFFQKDTVWVPVTAFSKAAGMKIDYTNEDGIKEWKMSYRPNEITDETRIFYLHVEEGDIYLMTEGGSFSEDLKVIKGVVYAPVESLTLLTEYDSSYKKEAKKLYINARGKSQDKAIQKLVMAYLKDYEHLEKMNLKLYHSDYLSWGYGEKYPSFLSLFLPGENGNPGDSKLTISKIKLHELSYDRSVNKAELELEYIVSNNTLPIHSYVQSRVWMKKLNGDWKVRLILDGYTSQINEDVVQKQAEQLKAEPDLVLKVKEDANQYYNAYNNKDVKSIAYWTNLSELLDEEGNPYSEEKYEKELQYFFDMPDDRRETIDAEVITVTDDKALVLETLNNYDTARYNSGEPRVEKKLSEFKKMQDGRWGFTSDICVIDEQFAEPTGYGPAYTED